MDERQLQEQAQHKQKWGACDPITLVASVRQGVYSDSAKLDADLLSGIEEVLSRFDQQTRATIGGSTVFSTAAP